MDIREIWQCRVLLRRCILVSLPVSRRQRKDSVTEPVDAREVQVKLLNVSGVTEQVLCAHAIFQDVDGQHAHSVEDFLQSVRPIVVVIVVIVIVVVVAVAIVVAVAVVVVVVSSGSSGTPCPLLRRTLFRLRDRGR